MSAVQFFATGDDLRELFRQIEADQNLTYTRAGHLRGNETESYSSGCDLPHLGQATSDASIACDAYLVTPRTSRVVLRRIDASAGPIVTVDQLLNPDSVIIHVGGLVSREVLLAGDVGAAHETPISRALLATWRKSIVTLWTDRDDVFVGPNALKIMNAGVRLTWSVSSPREYDLR